MSRPTIRIAWRNAFESWPLAETSRAATARASAASAAALAPTTPEFSLPKPRRLGGSSAHHTTVRRFSSTTRRRYAADASLDAMQTLHPPSHLASYFYPAPLRRHYLALQALHLELSLIPTTVSSEILGRIRYGWWRDAVRACFLAKEGDGSAARRWKHPIIVALEKAIWDPEVRARGGLVQDHFEAIIDAWVSLDLGGEIDKA